MNSNFNQTEILLMTNTGFISMDRLRNDESERYERLSYREKLIDDCWNGLLPEILPECFSKTSYQPVTLWEVNEANAFVDLVFCSHLQYFDQKYSINPYRFVDVLPRN